MTSCIKCLRGLFDECGHVPTVGSGINSETVGDSPELLLEHSDVGASKGTSNTQVKRRKQRRLKNDDAVRDQQSTGRKRAARLYPLNRASLCEWAEASPINPKGGGTQPVTVGCGNRKQQARHHGPDKNTLNNDDGNVHRICHWHHNLWHRINDPDYDPNNPLKAD